MCISFVLLAESTALNIAADERGKAGPPELSGDQLTSFQKAGVACGFMIVAPFQDGAPKGIICGDIDTAFVRQDAGLNLPISKAGTKRERNVLMHGLEGLEDEGVTRRGGFNVVGEGGVNKVHKEGWR